MAREPVTNDASRKFARWGAEVFVALLGVSALEFARRANLAWCERHVVIDHWVHDDNVATVARNWRIAAVTVGIVTVVVVRPLLGRWVERVGVRRALAAAGPIVVALVLALAVSEGALEYLRSKRPDPLSSLTTEARIGQPDPRYGWVWQPSRATVLRTAGRTIEYAINAEHDRGRSVDDLPDPSLPTVLVTGESISAGHGLSYGETFAAKISDSLGLQVVNLGVPAYGSDQAFLRLADALPRFDHPVALVTLFLPCMIWRMARANHPRVSLESGGTTLLPAAKSWRDLALGQLWVSAVRYDSDTLVERAAALFRETARLGAERGAKVLFVRPYFGDHDDASLLDELFARQGIPWVSVDIGAEFLPLDYHPDARAARRIADAVVSGLKGVGLEPGTHW
jgi:hypothetical protein